LTEKIAFFDVGIAFAKASEIWKFRESEVNRNSLVEIYN